VRHHRLKTIGYDITWVISTSCNKLSIRYRSDPINHRAGSYSTFMAAVVYRPCAWQGIFEVCDKSVHLVASDLNCETCTAS